jgi:hypothetical protein
MSQFGLFHALPGPVIACCYSDRDARQLVGGEMSEAMRSHMTDMETNGKSPQSNAVRRPGWPPWMESILDDWRERWPAAFTRPVRFCQISRRQV